MTETSKPPRRGFSIFLLLTGLALLAIIILHSQGIYMMERTEETRIFRPGKEDGAQTYQPARTTEAEEAKVEKALRRLAAQISDDAGKASGRQRNSKDLSASENQYLNAIKDRISDGNQLKSSREWLGVLTTSYKTYDKVRSIFSEAGGSAAAEIESQGVNQVMREEGSRAKAMQRLRKNFDVPEDDLEAFSRLGKKKLSDWALFLEEYAQ